MERKPLDKKVNLETVEIFKMDWDLEIEKISYDIYKVNGYCHTLGGRYGNNDYYCCKRDEEPTVHNLIPFNGEAPVWSIEWFENNIVENKWGEVHVRNYGRYVIRRNCKIFYTHKNMNSYSGLANAQVALEKIKDNPISFASIPEINSK